MCTVYSRTHSPLNGNHLVENKLFIFYLVNLLCQGICKNLNISLSLCHFKFMDIKKEAKKTWKYIGVNNHNVNTDCTTNDVYVLDIGL